MQRIHWCLTIAVAVWMLPDPLAAQPNDIRLSPIDSIRMMLPLEYRIQSATIVGERKTLAVWGTSVAASDGGLVGALRMQLLEGPQYTLTLPDARPFSFVRVLPLSDGFLVVWNDRRSDTPGIYTQLVDTNGALIGRERRISPGRVAHYMPSAVRLLRGSGRATFFLWEDDRDNIRGRYGISFDSAGLAIDDEVPLKIGEFSVLRFARLPWSTIIRYSDGGGRLIDHAAKIDAREIAPHHLTIPYFIGHDTSLVTLAGDTLLYYRSMFDASPLRAITVGALDSAFRQTAMIWRDSSDTITLCFQTYRTTGSINEKGEALLTGYRMQVLLGGEVTVPELVSQLKWGSGGGVLHQMNAVGLNQGCNNNYLLQFDWKHDDGYSSSRFSTYISLDDEGYFMAGPRYFTPSCDETYREFAARGPSSLVSRIIVTTYAGAKFELDAPIGIGRIDVPETNPGLALDEGHLLCNWQTNLAGDISMTLSEWNPGPIPVIDPISNDLPRSAVDPCTWIGAEVLDSGSESSIHLMTIPGLIGVVTDVKSRTVVRYRSSPVSVYEVALYCGETSVTSASRLGWRKIAYEEFRSGSISVPASGGWYAGREICYDPNSKELTVAIMEQNVSFFRQTTRFYRIDLASGARRLLATTSGDGRAATFVPLSKEEYLRIRNDDTVAVHYRGDTVVGNYTFLPTPGVKHYQRLPGSMFIRWSWNDSLRDSLVVESFDLQCRPLAAIVIPTQNQFSGIAFAQNPNDSTLAFVRANGAGIRATILDANLNVIVRDTLLSSTATAIGLPTAIYRGDTLFVAWADLRDGISDIYGGMLVLGRFSTRPRDRDTTGIPNVPIESSQRTRAELPPLKTQGMRIIPNPAREKVTIQVASAFGGIVVIDIADLQGSLVLTDRYEIGPASNANYEMDIRGLLPGYYLVRCRIGDIVRAASLAVE